MTTPADVVAELFELTDVPDLTPRYNIAPTQPVAAVRVDRDEGDRRLVFLRWGLIPHWAKDQSIGARMINARSETAATKPSFRTPMKYRRCLIPTSGFYEWQKCAGGKQPFLIRMNEGEPFAFAGLYDRWDAGEGDPVESCTILTTQANERLAQVHDRMPVILHRRDYDRWLDPELTDGKSLSDLLVPFPAKRMGFRRVSKHVNKPANDDPRCVEEIA